MNKKPGGWRAFHGVPRCVQDIRARLYSTHMMEEKLLYGDFRRVNTTDTVKNIMLMVLYSMTASGKTGFITAKACFTGVTAPCSTAAALETGCTTDRAGCMTTAGQMSYMRADGKTVK